jgi:hypothetical protein
MELDCTHLSLARYWTDEDDDRRIALVDSLDALRLCDEGTFEAVSSADARWNFERDSRRLCWEIQDFAVRVGLASPFSSSCDHDDLAELVRQAIQRGELVGLRKNPALFVRANKPTIEQRRLVAEISAKTRGRLNQGGRQYKLVAGDDLKGTSDRDSYDVVAREEARRVLDQLAREPGIAGDLAALLGKARDKLTRDWRPPMAPDGLILLRRNAAVRIASSETGPALTPSQIKKLAAKDWIEIEVVEEDDSAYVGSYRLERPDSTSTQGNFDAKGFFGDYDIETGKCKLTLGERIVAKAATAQVPAAATAATLATPTTTPDEAVWISFEVVDEAGQQIASRRYSLALSDSSTKQDVLAGSTIRYDNIPAGACDLTLFTPDAAGAAAAAAAAKTGAGLAGTGADSAETMLSAVNTAQIQPAPPAEVVPIKLRFKLLDLAGNAISGASVTVAGTAVTSDGDGMVETEITAAPQNLPTTLPSGDIALDVGSLNPQDDSSDDGYKTRLFNMGFLWDTNAGPTDDEMIIAVQDFQAQYQTDVSGQLDDATKAKLVEVYGC